MELCEAIVAGSSLNRFVIARGFAYSTVSDWLRADPVRWSTYLRSCEDRADMFADEIIGIADGVEIEERTGKHGRLVLDISASAVERDRLRIDARKWIAARMKPRVYGRDVQASREHARTLEELLEKASRVTSELHPHAGHTT